jgi:hypothetical protein
MVTVKSAEERKHLQVKALEYLQKSFDIDPEDYLVSFHLALQYAEVREVMPIRVLLVIIKGYESIALYKNFPCVK